MIIPRWEEWEECPERVRKHHGYNKQMLTCLLLGNEKWRLVLS